MLKICLFLIIFIVNEVLTTSDVVRSPLVNLGESTIEGKVLETKPLKVNQYLGIPYAQPPIGDLRFKPTQPLNSFPKALKAVTQPPACHQYTAIDLPFVDNAPGHSEDCLYLNIWAPEGASPSNTKAVLFWIFGGGFEVGSIRLDFYNGTELAALGDIVMVTVSSRLGALGYLSSNTEDAPGNAGLWDLLEGLKWVNRNIKAFGGDPDRITISGESSGSILVGLLSISPLSKGLFKRQILESGSPAYLVFDNTSRNEIISENISSRVGCSNETYTMKDHPKEVIGCLQKVGADVFAKLSVDVDTLTPQYRDDILPFNPRQTIANGHFNSKDTLIGVTRNEGSIIAGDYSEEFGFNGEIPPHLNKTAGREFMRVIFNSYFPNPDSIANYYLPDTLPENDLEEIERKIFQAYGDIFITCATLYHAEKVAEKGKSVFFYYWGHRANNSVTNPRFGVPHFEEVQFVFGIPLRKPQGYDSTDVQISIQTIEMWSNFVKYGDPNSSWPLFSRSSPDFQFFGTQSEKCNLDFQDHVRNCDFLRSYFGF